MRFGKIIITIFTLLLAVLGLSAEYLPKDDSLAVSVVSASGEEELLSPWVSYRGDAYFFLPGYTELSSARIRVGRDGCYLLDGQPLENAAACDSFDLNRAYELTVAAGEEAFARTLTFVRSGGVDTIFLDLQSGSTDDLFRDKEHRELSQLRVYGSDGVMSLNMADVWVKGRGNSTWGWDKKPLNLEFMQDTEFLGMEPAKNWVLLANAMDKSHLRNKIVMDFADMAGLPYSPESRWVDLYLNGEYAGLYLLCERNEIHTNRVNLTEEGSFLVYKDGFWRFDAANEPYIMTESGVSLRIYQEDLNRDLLLSQWQSAENAILAEDGVDPVTGKHWTELISLESWTLKFLIEEVFGNTDGMAYSQFFYYDASQENPKIQAGPVWDYDLSIGNRTAIPEYGYQLFFTSIPDVYVSPWYAALYEKEAFRSSVMETYESLFRPLLAQLMETGIGEYARQIEAASKANDLRWYIDSESEVQYLLDYLSHRIAFLDEIWIGKEEFCAVTIKGYNNAHQQYMVKTGETMPLLPEYYYERPVKIHGWFYQDTDEPVDMQRPITENVTVYLKYEVLEQLPEEEEYEEPMTLLRIMPCILLLCMFAVITGVGIGQLRREKRNREGNKRNEIPS